MCTPAATPDRDRDAILDPADACPDLSEDYDRFDDEDGCPDRDDDRDGIPDAHEWTGTRWTNCDLMIENGVTIDCRHRPEDRDGHRDEDGCPDLDHFRCADPLVPPLLYDPKTLRFAPAELERLSPVLEVVRKHPDLHLWIEGHTGKQRDPKRAKRQAQRVAEVIRDELVRRGIPATAVLDPISWGHERPRDTERTPEGRRNNHRVDIVGDGYCDGERRHLPKAVATCL